MANQQSALQAAARADYYARIDESHLTPLWEVLHDLVTPEPVSPVRAAHWSYGAIRPKIMESGSLITAKEAERRVLILENPGLSGLSAITRTLYAGFQLILPGEVAPAHRHTQSALRFVIEGAGAFTAVDGERTTMRPGDLVITPSWTWHDHGNPSSEPMVWLDGLDIPLMRSLDASYSEKSQAEQQQLYKAEGLASASFSQGLFPVDWKPDRPSTPIFNYPYARTREALAHIAANTDPDPCHAYKLRYVNPANGDYPMPTISPFMSLLPDGFVTSRYRSSDATVFVVVEGEGQTRIGENVFDWKPHDVFVVPPWTFVSHAPKHEAVLFSYSDRAVQEKLGFWREDRGNQ